MRVSEIAEWLDGDIVGNHNVEIKRVAKIEDAGPEEISFLANPKYDKFVSTTRASVLLVPKNFDHEKSGAGSHLVFIKVEDPYLSFLKVLKKLTPAVDPLPSGIHPSAIISPTAKLWKGVSLGAHVVIEDGVEIGENTKIGHGSVIGPYVSIGKETALYSNVVVYHQCKIGDRVIIHSGTVVGSDGFGFAPRPDGTYEKIPQLGIVVIEDDVEIGSNCSIDRATIGETVIKKGTKLDNLIQVAHNVSIGENTVIAAQVGISGSCKIGRNNRIGGQVGIAGHLEIADDTTIMAQSGISKSVKESGKILFGSPAKDHMRASRIEGALRSLPELMQEVRLLQQKVEHLKELLEKK